MRYFYHILVCAALLAFFFGLVYGTNNAESEQRGPNGTKSKRFIKNNISPKILPAIDNTLRPCSEVNTMPCSTSPLNPLKEKLDSQDQREGLFKKGEEVTCIESVVIVTHWSDGDDESVKNLGLTCKVLIASEEYPDLEPNYQHLKVKCNYDLPNVVQNHKLNNAERWTSSSSCYHFVQH